MTQVQRLQRLEKKIDTLVEKQTTPEWVKVSFITRLTGWDNEKMRQARNIGLIAFEKRADGSWWYDLNSLNEKFIIK